ncbi:SDR family oxidoreductase [Variovorax humicola]|uniref:SDR family oxidoreductase n=1 Tax=Variovorax humicola TaxID=1769758 RepID=A0ABU8W8D7_9BURK
MTGATGFVGASVVNRLRADSETNRVSVAIRNDGERLPAGVVKHFVGEQDAATDWSEALRGVSAVVHCAARVHVMKDGAADPLEEFRTVNCYGTLSLARQAAAAGVRRLVYVSSIGVNGAETVEGPYSAADAPAPHSPYAVSKLDAELGLGVITKTTDLEVVIVRPPLVYGPCAPGNFRSLVRLLLRGVPLPLGAVRNRRSYVALDNLADFLITCVKHPAAANQTFLVSDGEDLSTTDLLRRMAKALGKSPHLIPVPPVFLALGARLVGRPEIAQRLCGSLQVDISKSRELLNWSPPISVDEGLKRAAKGYLREATV